MGDAVTTTLLLSGWERYGLSERVCYHFDLTEALASTYSSSAHPPPPLQHPATAAPSSLPSQDVRTNEEEGERNASHTGTTISNSSNVDDNSNLEVCGVVGLLECVPFTPLNRLTKRQKRGLRNEIRDFNLHCLQARQAKARSCHEPRRLPLRLNPASRLFFAYEVTRMVFCLDASPTLTSTYGGSTVNSLDGGWRNGAGACCPMDRVGAMAKTFFKALVEPIDAPSIPIQRIWRPELNVSVVAVYPRGTGLPQTSLLVRDFRVHDMDSAEALAKSIQDFSHHVEAEIARRLSVPPIGCRDRASRRSYHSNPATTILDGHDAWSIQLHSSSLRDILDAGDVCLSILSSEARPCIVVATDGRSVSCDGVMDILADADRSDVPLVVLDLSNPQSHSSVEHDTNASSINNNTDNHGGGVMEATCRFDRSSLSSCDPGGPSTFPLHLSDDTKALYGICNATGGCFFDAELLEEAAKTHAGQVEESSFHADHYFSFKRRSVKPNAVQWYILFSLSPLSPTFNASWGKFVPPSYLCSRLISKATAGAAGAGPAVGHGGCAVYGGKMDAFGQYESKFATAAMQSLNRQSPAFDVRRLEAVAQRKQLARTTFSTYIVSPIRIKGLLMMRVKEGYRARQYGQSTQDNDKVLIQFNLPLELGTILHYELSYKALPNQGHMVGVAHVKIELSGEPCFIQSVKHDFLRQAHAARPETMAQQVSARLCKILRWIRREDCLQSYLCPLRWSDQLASAVTPFVRRLWTLTDLQRRKHFRFDQFDVVCTGRMPYALDDGFLSEFLDTDTGEQELFDTIAQWSTQTIKENSRYVKQTESAGTDLANYCVIELGRSPVASRVFTVAVEFFAGTSTSDRLEFLALLRDKLFKCKEVKVLSKQMADYLVGVRKQQSDHSLSYKQSLLENQHHHASWDLVKDPELLPLIMKRRTEIGFFILLDSSETHALFAKLIPDARRNTEDLIEYQIAILRDRVVIDLHMESTSGDFFPFRPIDDRDEQDLSQFHRYAKTLRRRDQECGHALRCRTALLGLFQEEEKEKQWTDEEGGAVCVERLLPYANRVVRKVRFFNPGAGSSNDILQNLSESLLLSNSFGVRVARIPISPGENVGGLGKGIWFVIELDRHTMSMIHHSLVDRQETGEGGKFVTYRELTYFTIGISDLYSQRDDIADDDSTNSHLSEYLAMVEFADHWDSAHTRIYSTAAYHALTLVSLPVECFHADDFDRVLGVCEFVEVASVLVGGSPALQDNSSPKSESKLQELMFMILGQVSLSQNNQEHTLFYYKSSETEDTVFKVDEQETDSISAYDEIDAETDLEMADDDDQDHDRGDDLSATGDFLSRSDDGFDRPQGANDDDNNLRRHDFGSTPLKELLPPVFVRVSLDGKAASLADLSSITKSTNLAVQLSLFRDDSRVSRSSKTGERAREAQELPAGHRRVALEVGALLNAYVAEQNLERLMHFGQSLTEDDLKVVKGCFRGARNVLTSKIEVYFYSGKIDSMVPASAPAGGEGAIAQGFALLKIELENNTYLKLQKFTGDVFVAMESQNASALDYFCFINIRRTQISVKVHHPQGAERAYTVMSKVQELIAYCCHRVNQQLLLNRLHLSRTASELLVPKDTMVRQDPEVELEQLFRPGVFACPAVFTTCFDLFHRCATNPAQVARKLEGTVLHSFAVSNRRNIFVYKDETGEVFYMKLESHGGGVDPDGKIDLLVYGIQEPGPSITSALPLLLRRRILLVAVEMLSGVLTKNPHFHWKRADLNFIRRFEDEWRVLDDTYDAESGEQVVDYQFPQSVNSNLDLGIILLYFRQNLCGSTFFHRLNGSFGEIKYETELSEGDERIILNPNDFTFYYNNSPSKLDPNFQSVSTLTEKGASYSRQAGAGIAIISVSLIYSNGEPVESLTFGLPVKESSSSTDIGLDSLQLSRVDTFHNQCDVTDPRGQVLVRVSVTSTALKLTALHNWVLLTLNQEYSAWCLERHLEGMQCNLIQVKATSFNSGEDEKKRRMDVLCPGLPAFVSYVDRIFTLPHPAFSKTENVGVIRASSVASVTLELLETIMSFSKIDTMRPKAMADIFVIRLSRSEAPQRVRLLHCTPNSNEVTVQLMHGGIEDEILRDKPIDCPEYICFYCHTQYSEVASYVNTNLPMLFREVVVDDGNSDKSASIARLEKIKESNPHFFSRSFSFLLSVKRNTRAFLTYNWTPQIVKKLVSRLSEKDTCFLKTASQSGNSFQLRALQDLSPLLEGTSGRPAPDVDSTSANDKSQSTEQLKSEIRPSSELNRTVSSDLGPKQKINRPTCIRRPKLIGKSVEGAAMQAVAASRARASNKQCFGRPSATATSGHAPKGQCNDEVKESKQANIQLAGTKGPGITLPQKRLPPYESVVAAEKFDALLATNTFESLLPSSRQWLAVQALTSALWPANDKATIQRSVAEAILSSYPRTWSDVREVPSLPPRVLDSLVLTCAQTVRVCTPGILLLPVPPYDVGKASSVLLMGETKGVGSFRRFGVFIIGLSRFGIKGRKRNILRCEGWAATLPRKHPGRSSRAMNLSHLQKASAGVDKLTMDLHATLDVDCLIFDLLGLLIERVMKSFDIRLMHSEIIFVIKSLLLRYPLEFQRSLPRLNYRVFVAPVILSSYENRLINFYSAPLHYEWLCRHASDRGLTCDKDGICFQKEILLPNGVNGICFLTSDRSELEKMELLIVSRTQGKSMREYMFRNGSNVGYTVMDHLAAEAAAIAYEGLRCSARDLRRDDLWLKASKEPWGNRRQGDRATREEIEELLVLIPPQPLLDRLSNEDKLKTAMVLGSGLKWLSVLSAMGSDPSFSPSHIIDATETNPLKLRLFYIRDQDLFLSFQLDANGNILSLDIIAKEERLVVEEISALVTQRLSNYMLHFLWFAL